MKKIAFFLLYSLLFIAALLFFSPKESLYYYAEEQLKPLGVVIGYEEVSDNGFSLSITDAKLYVQKIKSANIDAITIAPYLFYNTVSVKNIVLDSTFKQFFPPLITDLSIVQSIFNPLVVHADAHGDFGEAHARVNLVDRNGSVIVRPSKLMVSRYRNTMRELKRTKAGEYHYEFKF